MEMRTIVEEYRRVHRPRALKEVRYFQRMPDFTSALRCAACAIRPDGKMYDHQRRIGANRLAAFHRALERASTELEYARAFSELLGIIDSVAGGCDGIGDLAVYDTAFRLGSYLRVMPDHVYLHAGAARGARALGLDSRSRALPIEALPEDLRVLAPWEAEDVLCLFKGRFLDAK